MTAAQRLLIEKTLGYAGYSLLVLLTLTLVIGFAMEGLNFIGSMLGDEDVVFFIWPAAIASGVVFWIRAFMRAGRKPA